MKWAIVYNPTDKKLIRESYSWSYRCMFLALLKKLGKVQHVITDCNAKSIEADVILFWDIHSSHHIKLAGIEKHTAIKIEYFNDPHQDTSAGYYGEKKLPVYKLGAKDRVDRTKRRGVHYIISPYRDGYHRFIAPHIGADAEKMLIWLPISPAKELFEGGNNLLTQRKQCVLATGWNKPGQKPPPCYEFRAWAFEQPGISYAGHNIFSPELPKGKEYGKYLIKHAGALALMDYYPVPKYFEIPMAGCVCFAQYHKEYEELGFVDGESCIYVNRDNMSQKVNDFLWHIEDYQDIADKGEDVALKYTADTFAEKLINIINAKANRQDN